MLDINSLIKRLKRPNLLVRAARFGVDDYRRERDLLRLLDLHTVPKSGEALIGLIDLEQDLNRQRVAKDATYTLVRHIEVLTAIMCEARLLQEAVQPRH